MISEESINELLQQLESLGFLKENIERELRGQVALNIREFSIARAMTFGEDKMRFDLWFRQNTDGDSVQLAECRAVLLFPVPVDDLYINGISTTELDAKMKGIDWEAYLAGTIADESLVENARQMLDDLWCLSRDNDKGLEIQNKLVYKYFPEQQWNEDVKRLSYNYQSYSKTITDFDDWNVRLCYMQLSGKLDDILDLLSKLKLSDIDVYSYPKLYQDIAAGNEEFDLKFSFNQPEGLSDIFIPIRRTEDGYGLDTYTVEYTPYPAIEHGVYNHVDTKLLEQQMQQIDWRDDNALFEFTEDEEPEIKPEPALVSEQLFHLSKDLVGADIADLLHLKYFIGVTFFEDNILETAWDQLDELPKRVSSFSGETPVKEATSLLAGKAVLIKNPDIPLKARSTWQQYVFDEENRYHHTKLIKDYPVKVLEQQLRMLLHPALSSDVNNNRDKLLSGDTIETLSYTGKKIFIQADPAGKALRVFDENKKEVAVNFNLDADWRPDKNVVHYQRISSGGQTRGNKPAKKNTKGKGLKH